MNYIGKVCARVGIGILYLFLFAPIIIIVIISFSSSQFLTFPPPGFGFEWYRSLAHNSDFIHGFVVSIIVGGVVAALDVAVGVPVALSTTRYRFAGRKGVDGLFLSPLVVPTIVLGLGLLLILEPLGLVGTYPGLVVGHFGITIPYIIRTVTVSLGSVQRESEEAAGTLGATKWNVFRLVTLPQIIPGIVAGVVMAFVVSFDEAVISLFIVGGNVVTLPVAIFHFVENQATPEVAALSVVLIAISAFFVIVTERALGLRKVVNSST